ncbi:MAG TPA: RNA 2',3'-cyclic phosphodiesterase [Rhizomicrobium sp.]|jgi:2'-5' RNA ligase
MRLFVALSLPDAVAGTMFLLQSGVPAAKWQTREQLHLTLRFLGEVDGREANAVDDALAAISTPPFSLSLKGVGEFGGKTPRALWAGVSDPAAVSHLARKIETAMQRIGLPAETRKFTPHVTLARLRGAPAPKVLDWLSDHVLYASAAFEVRSFALYSSQLSHGGSVYVAEREYRLG